MRLFFRIVILNVILSYVLAFSFPSFMSKPPSEFQPGEWLLSIWVILSSIGIFFWWGYMFFHWGVSQFESVKVKRMWFWVNLIGTLIYLIGPFVYYIVVYEMGKGLKPKVAPA